MRHIKNKVLSIIGLIIFYVLFCQEKAYAEPVTAAIWTVLTIVGDWIWAHPVIAALTAASIGYSVYSYSATDKYKSPSARYSSTTIENTYSNEEIVPIVYGGPIVVGGNIIWQSDPAVTVQRFLGLSVGEIDTIQNVKVDDTAIEGLSGCSYTAYYGTSTQVVDSRCSGIVKGLRDIAYLALTLTGGEKVSGNPVVSCEVIGRKIQTWNTGTESWSTNDLDGSSNPAAIVRDYMLLSVVLGGCGIPAANIDDESFGEFAEYCDELVDNGSGGTEKRYELCIVIDTLHSALDNIDRMLITCGAGLIKSAEKYKIVYKQSDSVAVQAFTERNIAKDSFSYGYGKTEESPNRVIIEWNSPLEPKNPKRTEIAEDELDQEVRGIVVEKIEMYGIARQTQASRMAKKILYDHKINDIWCQFGVSDMSALHCEPGDVVSITHSIPNWTAALFTIASIEESNWGRCKILAQAYNSSVHDDKYGSSFDDWDYGSPPNPYAPVTDVTGIVLTEVGWRNSDGTHIAHIDVSWAAPATKKELLSSYVIELKKEDNDFVQVGTTTQEATEYRINLNLEINKNYYVKVKTKSINNIVSDGTTSSMIRLVGKDAAPSDVSSFIVKKYRDYLICKWTKVSDVDVQKYEIRKGSDWNSGGIVVTPVYGDEALVRDIKVGVDQSYWIKSIDNSGNYSVNATEALITIANIPFQNIIVTYTESTYWLDNANLYSVAGEDNEYKLRSVSEDYEKLAQSFTTVGAITVEKISLKLKEVGNV